MSTVKRKERTNECGRWVDMWNTVNEMMAAGFKKVGEDGGSFVVDYFYNEDTHETKSFCVRDYDYSDGSRDMDEFYFLPIDEDAHIKWCHHRGVILVGDNVVVYKGRKVPVGTIGVVKNKRDVYNQYHKWVATYVDLDNGYSTNIDNVKLA